MPDGSTPATAVTLTQILDQLEIALTREERGDAFELLGRAKQIIANVKQAAALEMPITLPTAVDHVIHERRNRLSQVRALFAGAFAMAEAADDSSDVRWAMEAALELFEQAIESLEPTSICADAQEVANG